LIVEAKNAGVAHATASIFNEEYRQKMFVFIYDIGCLLDFGQKYQVSRLKIITA